MFLTFALHQEEKQLPQEQHYRDRDFWLLMISAPQELVLFFAILNYLVFPTFLLQMKNREKLAKSFPEFFHKIILDAPCSGEGMFRKEEALARDWTPEKSRELSLIQRQLSLNAADRLQPEAMMLYSTCTFAPAEDEEIISWLLSQRPELSLVSMEDYEGFSKGVPEWGDGNPELIKCIRIFPHKMDGEGHFLALLQKEGQSGPSAFIPKNAPLAPAIRKYLEEFFQEIGLTTIGGQPLDWKRIEVKGEKIYYLPPVSCSFRGITFLLQRPLSW